MLAKSRVNCKLSASAHLLDVLLVREGDHDIDLLQLDIDGVVILAEEDLDLGG